jgi:hypothetical protein
MREATVEGLQRQPRAQPYQEDILSEPPEGEGHGIIRPGQKGKSLHPLHSVEQGVKGAITGCADSKSI